MKMMPGRVAQIEWREDDQRRVGEVIVFDRTVEQTERQIRERHRRYENSHGACTADWMDGNRARSTPEGQFLSWVRDGFVDDMALLAALDQLGQIEEAGFARTMAKALREQLLQERGGEDEGGELEPPEYDAAT